MEEGKRGVQPPSCDLKGDQPHSSVDFFEVETWKNQYSAVKNYFSCKELSRNC